MEAMFLTLLNMSLTASYLVAVVLLLRLVLRRAPRGLLCLLWAMVGIRLVLPFSPESILSLIPRRTVISEQVLLTPAPSLSVPIEATPALPSTAPTLPSVLPQSAPVAKASLTLGEIAAVVWLLGAAALASYALISYILIARRVRESTPRPDGSRLCDRIATPFILGVVRPRIYLPATLSEQDTVYVLAHERAHLRRLDHWWKPLGFAILIMHWFNPVLWIAYLLLCRDIELACDERVIRDMGAGCKQPYSEALLRCSIDSSRVTRARIAACPLAFGEVSVKQRIRSVLHYKKPTLWILLALAVALSVTAICFLTDPVQDDEQPDEPPAEEQAPTPEDTVTLSDTARYFTTTELAWIDATSSILAYPSSAMGVTYAIDGDTLYLVGQDDITPLGILRDMNLNEDNFDDRMIGNIREFTYTSGGKEVTGTAGTPPDPIQTTNGLMTPAQLRASVKNAYTCTLIVDDHSRIELTHLLLVDETTAYLIYSDTATKRYYSMVRAIRSESKADWGGGVLAIGDSVYHNMASSFADILSDTYYRVSDDLSRLSVLREGSYTYIGAMAEIPIPEQYLNMTEAPAFWSREVDIRSVLNKSTRLFRISATETERAPTAPSHLLLTEQGDIYMVKGGGFSVYRMVQLPKDTEPEYEGLGFYALALRDGGTVLQCAQQMGNGMLLLPGELLSGEPLPEFRAGDMLYIRCDGKINASNPGQLSGVYSVSVVSAYQATYGVEAPYHVTILDVDGDGKDEKCYITKSPKRIFTGTNPTSTPIATFGIFIRDAEDSSTKYSGVFYAAEFDDFQLLKAEDGSIMLEAQLHTLSEDGLLSSQSVYYSIILGTQSGKDICLGEGEHVLYSPVGPLR